MGAAIVGESRIGPATPVFRSRSPTSPRRKALGVIGVRPVRGRSPEMSRCPARSSLADE